MGYRTVFYLTNGIPWLRTVSTLHLEDRDTIWLSYLSPGTHSYRWIVEYENGNIARQTNNTDYYSDGVYDTHNLEEFEYDEAPNVEAFIPDYLFPKPNRNNMIRKDSQYFYDMSRYLVTIKVAPSAFTGYVYDCF